MIDCPVCRHKNDDLALKCSSCGSYVQDRVPTLDLFAMMWMLIETPKQALKKIVLAEHKNFVLLQAVFLGISVIFGMMWAGKSGDNYDNLLPLLLHGSFFGLVTGVPFFLVLAAVLHGTVKIIGGQGRWNETYGVLGWSLMPIVLSTVFILPLELGTIGLYFFSTNPTGYELKPVVFLTLVGLDLIAVLWSIFLSSLGLSIAHRFNFLKSLTAVLAVLGLFFYGSFYIYSSFIYK